MIVALVHTKGGVAKTTSAMGIAFAAHGEGIPVEVLDGDGQGSAVRWSQVAEQRGNPLPFQVRRTDAAAIRHRADRADSHGLTIIDTPPGTAAEIQAAIDVADLVIIPTGAAQLDLDRVWPTLEVTQNVPTAVLITRVLLNARLYEDASALFESEKVPVFRSPIPQREELKNWFGGIPLRLNGYDDVFKEIRELSHDLEAPL